VFFGTPEWAVPSLRALLASDFEVAAVVTNQDKPAGRGLAPRPSPVKELALEARVELLQPARARDPELRRRLRALDVEVATVVAYGRLLPGELLAIPPMGFVNLHFSLLPAYRGAAPVQRALMDGRELTGVSTMVLTEGLDEGPVLGRRSEAVEPGDTAGSLGKRLAHLGAQLLVADLAAYVGGVIEPAEQDHAMASYAPKVTLGEARVEWTAAAEVIRNLVRGLNPAPGAWTTMRGRRIKLWSVEVERSRLDLAPGKLADEGALLVGTGSSPLRLEEVQREGRRRMTGAELARGLRLAEREHFE
jgi:methionyl-tRNA formyltransferase